ncbi:MAG: hypothetical protein K5855_02210 [Oscillospiraceae bacterium]|nr:hypothetical protein [Oscillospiraceae bacterium]
MVFSPFVISAESGAPIDVILDKASLEDLAATKAEPVWQTDWTSAYLADPTVEKAAIKTPDGELIGMGAYQIRGRSAYVFILYAESAPHSNPTMRSRKERKYFGIGELLIAYGIKYSIDHGCRGDVVFEAKTDELARHYETDFHAKRIPSLNAGLKRFMLADEEAWHLFSKFLKEATE